jgi:hypothetical protein
MDWLGAATALLVDGGTVVVVGSAVVVVVVGLDSCTTTRVSAGAPAEAAEGGTVVDITVGGAVVVVVVVVVLVVVEGRADACGCWRAPVARTTPCGDGVDWWLDAVAATNARSASDTASTAHQWGRTRVGRALGDPPSPATQ